MCVVISTNTDKCIIYKYIKLITFATLIVAFFQLFTLSLYMYGLIELF